jgi:hypothetical protein
MDCEQALIYILCPIEMTCFFLSFTENDLTLYIAIGTGLGAVSLLIFVVTITVLKRFVKSNKQLKIQPEKTTPSAQFEIQSNIVESSNLSYTPNNIYRPYSNLVQSFQ